MNGDRIVFCKECGARYAVRAEVWAQAASGHFLLCSACGHGSPPSSGVTEDCLLYTSATAHPSFLRRQESIRRVVNASLPDGFLPSQE